MHCTTSSTPWTISSIGTLELFLEVAGGSIILRERQGKDETRGGWRQSHRVRRLRHNTPEEKAPVQRNCPCCRPSLRAPFILCEPRWWGPALSAVPRDLPPTSPPISRPTTGTLVAQAAAAKTRPSSLSSSGSSSSTPSWGTMKQTWLGAVGAAPSRTYSRSAGHVSRLSRRLRVSTKSSRNLRRKCAFSGNESKDESF